MILNFLDEMVMGVGFFKSVWLIIGEDVIEVVMEFFELGFMLKQLNIIQICVVFKIDNFKFVRDYRFIVCCNIFYKVIFKLLCNRISIVLFRLIIGN